MGRTRRQGGTAAAMPRHAVVPDPVTPDRTPEAAAPEPARPAAARRLADSRLVLPRVLARLPEPWVLGLALAAVTAVALADLWILRTGGSVLLALAPAAALVGMLIVLSHRQAAAYVMLASLPFAEISLGHGTSLVRYIEIAALGAWFIGVSVSDSARWLRPDRTDLKVLLWIMASVASAALLNTAAAPALAQTYLNLALVYYMASRMVRSPGQARGAILALSLGVAMVALLSLTMPSVAGSFAAGSGVLRQGPLGASGAAGINRFAAWLAVGVILPWLALGEPRRLSTVAARGASAVALVALIATASKAALIAVAAGLLIWVLLTRSSGRLVRITAVGAGLVIGYLLLPAGIHQRFAEFLQPNSHAYSRFAIWDAGWRIFLAHPLFGVGVGNFDQVAPAYFPQGTLYSQDQAAHNIIVGALAETGLVGTLLLIVMVGAILAEGIRLVIADRQARHRGARPGGAAGFARPTAGLLLGYLVFLTVAMSVDLERDRFFVVLAGLLHSVYRARVHARE